MRSAVAAVLLLVSSSSVWAAEPDRDSSSVAWGGTVGFPQLLALTFETHQDGPLRIQASASPLLLINSATARLILTRTNGRARPYVYGGGGVFNISEGEGGGPLGTTGFLWAGGGVSTRIHRFQLFADVGVMGGMDTAKGFESMLPAFGFGVCLAR